MLFCFPKSLKFAEYNGEVLCRAANAEESRCNSFANCRWPPPSLSATKMHGYPLMGAPKLLDRLVMAYIDWGGLSKKQQIAIVDWKASHLERIRDFLQSRFERHGCPHADLRSARILEFLTQDADGS